MGYHNVKQIKPTQKHKPNAMKMNLLEPRTLQNPCRSKRRLRMRNPLQLPNIHQLPATIKPDRNRRTLLQQQQRPLFPPLLHDNRPPGPDLGHALPARGPGPLPHERLVHHFEVLVVGPGGVLAPVRPDVVRVDEGFHGVDVVEFPLPVAELLHIVCVAAEGEDAAVGEVVLADVEVDLIVGEEDGDFWVDVFGLVEGLVEGGLDEVVVLLTLGGGDVFPEGGVAGWNCGVEGGDVVIAGVVI